MALKCLENPSRRLLQQCYSTTNPQPLLRSRPCTKCRALVSTPSVPLSTRSLSSVSVRPLFSRRSAPSAPPSRTWRDRPSRTFSGSTIRSATPQEAHGSSITASYIASAGELELVDVKKVLVIGSGGLSIGQAGEFDYSGMRQRAVSLILYILTSWVYRLAGTQSSKGGKCGLGPDQP